VASTVSRSMLSRRYCTAGSAVNRRGPAHGGHLSAQSVRRQVGQPPHQGRNAAATAPQSPTSVDCRAVGASFSAVDGTAFARERIHHVRSERPNLHHRASESGHVTRRERGNFEPTASYFRTSSGLVIGCQPLTPLTERHGPELVIDHQTHALNCTNARQSWSPLVTFGHHLARVFGGGVPMVFVKQRVRGFLPVCDGIRYECGAWRAGHQRGGGRGR
jgi:hypothetical protein